jgi:hypothetical protein
MRISPGFDRIDHQALLNKLNTFQDSDESSAMAPCRRVMGLAAPPEKGTPQASGFPLLANVALHGPGHRAAFRESNRVNDTEATRSALRG